MAKHDTSRARLLIAMQQFDVHHRGADTFLGNFTEKDPWPSKLQSRLLHHDGRYYPPKKIVKLAIPYFDVGSEQTDTAQRILEKCGFEVVNFGRKECPQTCCWDGFPSSRKFDRCLPSTGEEFWELLIQRAGDSDYGSVFEFNGNKRKIGGVGNEGAKITVYRPPKSGATEWSETPSIIDRGATITGYEKMLDSEGEGSGEIFSGVPIQNQAIVHLCKDLLEWTEGGEIRIKSVDPILNELSEFTQETFADEQEIDYSAPESTTLDMIKRRRFVILEGVPGTGKTHIFKEIQKLGYFDCTRFLTFHPSSDYSSFIGGIRPGSEDEKLIFNPTKGHLLNILEEAKKGPVLLWIDELNRANVPRVFGDLISLIGNSDPPALQILNAGLDDDKLELTDEQKKNLHIVATMNTSDRSVTPLDAALRRRFSFVRLQPMNEQELSKVHAAFSDKELEKDVGCFLNLNEILRDSMGEDAILGHSYLFEMFVEWTDDEGEWWAIRDVNELLMIWQFSILPNIVDTLMLTQNFKQIGGINKTLSDYNIPLYLETQGHGLGKMILIEVM